MLLSMWCPRHPRCNCFLPPFSALVIYNPHAIFKTTWVKNRFKVFTFVNVSGCDIQWNVFKKTTLSDRWLLKASCKVPTSPGKPGKLATGFPAWKNHGIVHF